MQRILLRGSRLQVNRGNRSAVGPTHLGAFQSALTGLLPDILVLMEKAHPQIDVSIARGTSAQLYRRLLNGDGLDAAFIARPPFALPKNDDWRLLRDEPLIVLTKAPAPSRRPHAILTSEPIRLDRGSWEGRLIDGYLRKVGIRPRERFEINSIEAIAVMVDRGLGVSLLPDWARPSRESLSLARILQLPDRSFSRPIGLIWPRASLRLRLVQAFLEQATAALAQKKSI